MHPERHAPTWELRGVTGPLVAKEDTLKWTLESILPKWKKKKKKKTQLETAGNYVYNQ